MIIKKGNLFFFPKKKKKLKFRYYETFITSYHNHLRIERMLASLSVTGFRKYAI